MNGVQNNGGNGRLLSDPLTRWLITILSTVISAAFLSWAGVVYNASNKIADHVGDMEESFHVYIVQANERIKSNEKEVEFLGNELLSLKAEIRLLRLELQKAQLTKDGNKTTFKATGDVMSTIATDGKTMASDTAMYGGWMDSMSRRKIYRIRKSCGVLTMGHVGHSMTLPPVKAWVSDGMQSSKPPRIGKLEFSALVVTNDGRCWYFDEDFLPIDVGYPHAIGSGRNFAMGAMVAGLRPEEAVRVAMKLDPYTSGDVDVLKVGLDPYTSVDVDVSKVGGDSENRAPGIAALTG